MVELKEEETSGWRDDLVVESTDYFLSEDPGLIPNTCTATRMSVTQACGQHTLSGHGARMQSCKGNSEWFYFVRKLQENKLRALGPQFLQKHAIILEMCFCAPPRYSG